MAGRHLPADWKVQAANNRLSFDEELRHRLENKWRTPLATTAFSAIKAARLGRFDGLKMVADDDGEEVWEGPGGVRVIRRGANGK